MSDKPILGVSACIWQENRVLIVQRGKPPAHELWSLPGGHVDLGEKLEDAARRELREETGVQAAGLSLVDFAEILPAATTANRHYVLAVFTGQWLSGTAQAASDAKDVAWLAQDQLAELSMTAGTRAHIGKAHAMISR